MPMLIVGNGMFCSYNCDWTALGAIQLVFVCMNYVHVLYMYMGNERIGFCANIQFTQL